LTNKLTPKEKDFYYKSIIPIADEARKEFMGDYEPINNSFETIEQLGFLVLRFPSRGDSDLSGFFMRKSENNCIYINTNQTLGRQFTSIWHEYYHYYTNDGQGLSYVSKVTTDPSEFKADTFAGCILMPEKIVKQYIEINNILLNRISYIELIKMQNYFRVSLAALLVRLIQIYPNEKDVLQKRFAITKNNINTITRLQNYTMQANGDIRLIQPTNEVYIPESFYDNLENNLNNNRISKEKAYELLKVIEELFNATE
jgi:Zn-dependent peptidase ImmA (M78 family)